MNRRGGRTAVPTRGPGERRRRPLDQAYCETTGPRLLLDSAVPRPPRSLKIRSDALAGEHGGAPLKVTPGMRQTGLSSDVAQRLSTVHLRRAAVPQRSLRTPVCSFIPLPRDELNGLSCNSPRMGADRGRAADLEVGETAPDPNLDSPHAGTAIRHLRPLLTRSAPVGQPLSPTPR